MEIEIKACRRVEYELFGPQGSLGMFHPVSKWEGMLKLEKTGGGETLIIRDPAAGVGGFFHEVFAEIFNGTPKDMTKQAPVEVVTISPSLAAKAAKPAKTGDITKVS